VSIRHNAASARHRSLELLPMPHAIACVGYLRHPGPHDPRSVLETIRGTFVKEGAMVRMSTEALEARVQRLEDIEEIRRLKATYCDLCDAGLGDEKNRDALLELFIEDARVDFGMGEGSQFSGQAGLQTFFGQFVPNSVSFCMHMVHNSVIDVSGDTAKGRWYFEAPTTNAITNEPQWMAGRYIEEYVRVGEKWKFSSIETQWNYIAPYAEGWRDPNADFKAQAAGEQGAAGG